MVISCFYFYLICSLLLQVNHIVRTDENVTEVRKESEKAEIIYRRLFKLERAEQLAAVKALLKLGKEEKQTKMVHAIAEKVFSVIRKSRQVLNDVGYVPGKSLFPEDEKVRDALSNVLENAAFFSDIILRLPDVTEGLLNNNTEWSSLFSWSVSFSNESNLLDNKTITLMHLVSQEMNYTKREENFTNPYRRAEVMPTDPPPLEEKKKAKKKKQIARGPRLTFVKKTEL